MRVLPPSPWLRAFVRAYEYHPGFQQSASGTLPVWPHPYAVLAIRFGDPLHIVYRSTRTPRIIPAVVVAGPVTDYRVDIVTRKRQCAQFVVVFQPGAVRRLFGVSAQALINDAIPAEEILGPSARRFSDALSVAREAQEMAAITDAYLIERLREAVAASAIERVALAQLDQRGALPITDLIDESGYRRSRFEHRFVESVGVSPKLFARLVRFDYAVRLHANNRSLNWVTISHEAGYYDQNHLVKEFKALTGQPPSCLPDPDWRIFGNDSCRSGSAQDGRI